MKKLYFTLLALVLLTLTAVGFFSLVDKDRDLSLAERRTLAQKPKFTFSALFSGTLMEDLETYYTDQFPLRDKLMGLNTTLNKFYYYSGSGDSGTLLINSTGNAAEGGSNLKDVEAAENGSATTAAETTTAASGAAGESTATGAGETTETETETETEPALDSPEESDAKTVNSLLVVGDRGMEVVYGSEDLEDSYAQAVNDLAAAVGSGVKTYSLLTPNSAQFYSPESMHTGASDQKAMIDYIYSKLDSGITTVDAYSKLRQHVDEYIYFRTDHHWTALGAYYAYTAFCEASGLTAVKLDQFESGTFEEGFLGTLYNQVVNYPQGATMAANPDKVTYYLPIVKTDAKAYTTFSNGTLNGEYEVSTVATKVNDSYKYLCFLCGDQPIEVITTDVANNRVCIVIKESYGNAFVPFLTSHFSKIIVIDPRETYKKGPLDLAALASYEKATDMIVINYPYMPLSQTYINRLNNLIGK